MRFVVVGAGAIGGVVGGRLTQAGQDVVLVARGSTPMRWRVAGSTLRSPDGDQTIEVQVARSVGEIEWRPDDVVLLAVKSNDTVALVEQLEAEADPATAVVCLQNGVANERAALRRFANVYGVCVMCPATHLQPGLVAASSSPVTGIFDIGRYPTGLDATVKAIAAAFETATFVSEARPDIMRWKYAKLLMNLGNAVEAALGPEGRFSEVAAEARRVGGGRPGCRHRLRLPGGGPRAPGDLLQMKPIEGEERGGGSSWQSLARRTGGSRRTTSTARSCCSGASTACPPR